MVITGQILLSSNLTQTPVDLPGAKPVSTNPNASWSVASGTGSDQADLKCARTLHLVGAAQQLDLTSLTDLQGNPIDFARVKSLILINRSKTPGNVVLFGFATTSTNAHTAIVSNPGQVTIRPSSLSSGAGTAFVAPDATGYPVGPSSKLLNFDPGAATIDLDVEILGASV
jgi:hypothetical protein